MSNAKLPGPYRDVLLAAYRRRVVAPTPEIDRAFACAVRLAREVMGVVFGKHECRFYCFAGDPGEPSVTLFRERPVMIFLNMNDRYRCDARALTKLVLHEFAHAYFDSRDDLGALQREDRADAFANRALKGWR